MNIEFRENFSAGLYGNSGVAVNQNWHETGMALMNTLWQEVKAHSLKNKGINMWVYEENNKMFAGVELEGLPPSGSKLEQKIVNIPKYAYYKHIGPYTKIHEAYSSVVDELNKKGIKTTLPYLEVYGHWTEDESKLETELLWSLQ